MEYVVRLKRGQDLKIEIERFAESEGIEAGALICAVGCAMEISLRLADGKTVLKRKGEFEIVSATGTVSKNGCHIHISVAGVDGAVLGGHLMEGTIINTTCEIVVAKLNEYIFARELDDATGYKELITKRILLS